MKNCKKCGNEKPLDEFHKDSSKSDGKTSVCKKCGNENAAEYARKNKDKRQKAASAWYEKNAHRAKITGRAYRDANPEKVKENKRKYKERQIESGRLSPYLYVKLFKLQKGMCPCCRQMLDGVGDHMDHIVPLSLGGKNVDDNIQILHARCNLKKQAMHPVDYMQTKGMLL